MILGLSEILLSHPEILILLFPAIAQQWFEGVNSKDTGRQAFFMGRFNVSSGNWTLREQRINQVYNQIYFSYPRMSRSLAKAISSHELVSCPLLHISSCRWFWAGSLSSEWSANIYEKLAPLYQCSIFLRYCSPFYLRSWLVVGQPWSVWSEGVTTLWSLWDLTWAQSHFNRQTCGGAAAHYIIMLSGRLFILTSSSHTVTSSPTVISSIGPGSQAPAWTDVQHIAFKVLSNKTVACSLSTAAPTSASSNTPPSIINPAN